ncbi:nucleotidyltransferase family protein [Parabacteroides sp. FAFU027]|uniref:nucleotidyltransferase family protein n=1 Tax=Parabacteroides sp. FAFU027 TaxID=2922715 RepID=UPI001FAE79F7|nr:nucleotidyltransferase domain-containing protein [Parabacteroides sp. FAFU027]
MDKLIKTQLKKLKPVFQSHKVIKAYIFGSVLSDKFNPESDIDFLVTFQDDLEPLEKGELWWSLYDTLRELFHREIDLVTENSLKNPYFIEEVNQTKQLIYG